MATDSKRTWSREHRPPLWAEPIAWAELFAVANLAFLGVDIALAHAVNQYHHRAEYVPLYFSAAGSAVLLIALVMGGLRPAESPHNPRRSFAAGLAMLVGLASIALGVVGLLFHLDSAFFARQTVRDLVYAAPFAAPLAYTGIGLLILLNRMVPHRSVEWGGWVVILALFGFAGNFLLCLTDHAQNGFYHPTEWIGVAAAALATTSLLAVLVDPGNPVTRRFAWLVMLAQVFVGLVGFALHVRANLAENLQVIPSLLQAGGLRAVAEDPALRDSFIYGAPAFAPLLFANLAMLAALGLWTIARHAETTPLRATLSAPPASLS